MSSRAPAAGAWAPAERVLSARASHRALRRAAKAAPQQQTVARRPCASSGCPVSYTHLTLPTICSV
eukprot:14906090-Alexandrium_andersonii.AAC.1